MPKLMEKVDELLADSFIRAMRRHLVDRGYGDVIVSHEGDGVIAIGIPEPSCSSDEDAEELLMDAIDFADAKLRQN